MSRPSFSLRKISLIASTALAFFLSPAHAQLTIEISGSGANRIPVAIADFVGEAGLSRALTSVVRSDLERSGLFRLINAGGTMDESTSPVFAD